LMAAAQALDFRDYAPGRGVMAAKKAIRTRVAHLEEDRPLYKDHESMAILVGDRVILDAVEAEVGALAAY